MNEPNYRTFSTKMKTYNVYLFRYDYFVKLKYKIYLIGDASFDKSHSQTTSMVRLKISNK